MAQTSELGIRFAVLGKSFILGVRTLSDFDRLPTSTINVTQEASCSFPPNPFHTLITQMGLSANSSVEQSFVHLLLASADYTPRSWTHRTPAREVLHRLRGHDGTAYRRLMFLLNEQVEKETR
jgi:hypothetical protein